MGNQIINLPKNSPTLNCTIMLDNNQIVSKYEQTVPMWNEDEKVLVNQKFTHEIVT